ncbi:unnamed protein product [Callosobruchus maculatus]|uniref:Cytochrome P450 n=1 Tax=Callosobruchus maculatus TaxID=64391 RepID=A0A653BJ18_CALMS|nr:unnamed protein product [Callosobruchus maculatus]
MSEIRGLPQKSELANDFSDFFQKLLIVTLFGVFVYSLIYCGKRWKLHYHSWNVPGPVALPFIGCAYRLFGDPTPTTMGITMNVQSSMEYLGDLIHRFAELCGKRAFMIRYQFKFIWNHSHDKKVLEDCAKKTNDFSDSVVKMKLREHEERQQDKSCDHVAKNESMVERKSMLDSLIESSEMTDEELKTAVKTVLAGGTDTIANSSVFILLMLGLHPDVQQKVYEEVVGVLGREKSVEPEDLLRMEYTERVIKESLRLFPPVAFISRYVSEDVAIGNYIAPAGISLGIPIHYIHRCPSYWKDPMKFDPDRFLPDNVAERHPQSYMLFSFGIRNCIGWRYAMMNLTTFTARVIREFKVFTQYKGIEEIEVEMHVFSKIKNGPKLRLETRT